MLQRIIWYILRREINLWKYSRFQFFWRKFVIVMLVILCSCIFFINSYKWTIPVWTKRYNWRCVCITVVVVKFLICVDCRLSLSLVISYFVFVWGEDFCLFLIQRVDWIAKCLSSAVSVATVIFVFLRPVFLRWTWWHRILRKLIPFAIKI